MVEPSMDILFLARAVDAFSGAGDAIHVRELVDAWDATGARVEVVCMGGGRGRASKDSTLRGGSRFHTMRSDGLLRLYYLRQLAAFVRSLRIIAQRRTRVIYSRPSAGLSGTFDALPEIFLSKFAQVPLVIEINGWAEDEASVLRSSRFFVLRPLTRRISRWSFRHAAGFVAVDPSLASRLSGEYQVEKGKIRVVPNGVDPKVFAPIDKPEARRAAAVEACSPIVVFVGYLGLESDLKAAIRAIATLKEEFPHIVLLVLGSGQDESSFRNVVSQLGVTREVRFVGRVPHKQVPAYLSAADAGLVPMRPQLTGNPIKLFEYWACALPVVASAVPSLRIVTDVGGGILATPDSPEAWAAALRFLFLDPDARDKAGQRGRSFVVAERTWARTASSVLEFLRSLSSTSSGTAQSHPLAAGSSPRT